MATRLRGKLMAVTKRKLMAVTIKPELYEKAKAFAESRDIRVTSWVRQLVEAELEKLEDA